MASQTPDDFQDDRLSRMVFVGSPSRETTPDTFVNHSGGYGQITDSLITRDRETGMSRGFGKQVPPAYNIHPSGYPCSDSFMRHASHRSMGPSFVGVLPRDTFMEHSEEHDWVMRRDPETGRSWLTNADPSVLDTVLTEANAKNGEQVPPAYNIHPSGYPCSDSFMRHASHRSMGPSFVGVLPRDTFMEHSEEHDWVMRRDPETGRSWLTNADPSVLDTVLTEANAKNGEQIEIKNAESKTSSNPNPGKSDDDGDEDEIFDESYYYKPSGRLFEEFIKPRKGWVKLSIRSRLVDGVGIGGIVRNRSGDWVTGFYRRVKDGVESVELDLLVLKEGISLAAVIDKKLEIETESEELINLMKDEANDSIIDDLPHLLPLVKECRRLLTKLKDYKLIFRLGEGISATFELAVEGSELEHMNLVILDAPPEGILDILIAEST